MDLTKILKDAPIGLRLYSIVHGEVELEYVSNKTEYPITTYKDGYTQSFTKDGKFYSCYDGETVLFPSKNQRDWSKFTAPWYKQDKKDVKDRFDPKTLKPFDKVLFRDSIDRPWTCGLFSHANFEYFHPFKVGCCSYKWCIPYNEDTKHLAGTAEEAPKYYRYWED